MIFETDEGMEDDMSKFIGDWEINWDTFKAKFGVANLEELVSSTVPGELGGGIVDDFSAMIDENRCVVEPYLNIIPFGPTSTVVNDVIHDGDILSFVYAKMGVGGPVEILKQRGWHAEICFKSKDNIAMQRAPWGHSQVERKCNDNKIDWVIHVFRPIIPTIEIKQFEELKKQVRLWKVIFDKHVFPSAGDQYTGSHQYLDPADFNSVTDIKAIARKLISRSQYDMPNVPKVTCVQWAYQILCLSLNVPLNEKTLVELGVYKQFKEHWNDLNVLVPEDLIGADVLPFVPYSPAQVLQCYLDVYAKGRSLLEILREPKAKNFMQKLIESNKLPGLPEAISAYLSKILETGDISIPLTVQGRQEYRFVMPISFFCDSRIAHKKGSEQPWFQYVGTLIHESMVKRKN